MKKQIDLFVPGRLCLFGEHSDWTGTYMAQNENLVEGQAIVSGINLGIYATAIIGEKFEISSVDAEGEEVEFSCEMNIKELKQYAEKPFFFSYCCGVAAYICENYRVGGIKITITKVNLPMKKGLSSSAAVCCLVAKAFNELYGLHISTRGIMQIAYRGELLAGSRCGRLDQACAYGETPVLMHFSQGEIDVEKLRVGKTFYWVVADLCAGKDTKKILAYLSKAYPFATDEIGMREQEALGEDNHEIIRRAKKAMEEGNPEELGRIMVESQRIFDEKVAPACPDELSAPVLHSVLNDPKLQNLIYGAKGVGSQGDGTVQLLARDKESQKELIDYLNNERHMEAFGFNLNAGGKIKKAIIPIAGNGTRMFPQTFFTKKVLLPIIDANGIVKPALMYMLEELVDAEIEDIYLIVGQGEEIEYKKLFESERDERYRDALPEHVRDYYDRIKAIGQRVHFVVQENKNGFGHAVYQAREYLNKEPAIMMLGDFIYRSNLNISCTQQTINAYNKSGGKAVVSIKRVPFEESKNYGIIHGKFTAERTYLMDVDRMVEKPNQDMAMRELAVDGECFATFGQYVLTEEIFEYLEQEITKQEQNPGSGEVDVTKALMNLAERGELIGVDVAGESFDVGLPEMYYRTFVEYRN
ncbi:MAG: sugar phosphate nucleotidyltransferase [Acetatifactor sp.]